MNKIIKNDDYNYMLLGNLTRGGVNVKQYKHSQNQYLLVREAAKKVPCTKYPKIGF